MWCLKRLHLPPSPDKASAYLALWRHVGYYMGVAPSILHRHFASTRTADKFVATAALNLFLEDPTSAPPLPPSPPPSPPLSPSSIPSPSPSHPPAHSIIKGPTLPILVAVSNRAPLHASLEYNIALTTHLVGPPLAQRLGLPPTPPSVRLRMHLLLLAQRIPHYFAAWYPRTGWLAKRRAVLAEGMVRSVRWTMGMRRSAFRPRTDLRPLSASTSPSPSSSASAGTEKQEGGGGGGGGGGELAPGVAEAEAVQRDPARAAELTRQWAEVLFELVGVSVGVGVFASVVAYWGARSIASAFVLRDSS